MATDDRTRLAASLTAIRQKKPLIHHITNGAVMAVASLQEDTILRGQKVSIVS